MKSLSILVPLRKKPDAKGISRSQKILFIGKCLLVTKPDSQIKNSKAYQAVQKRATGSNYQAKEFLTIHETFVQHTRYAPEGSTTPGFRYPAPGYFHCISILQVSSNKVAVIPTTENTDRYFRTDLIQHDTRYLERDIHVVLSKEMKSLPKDIQMDFIKEHSLADGDVKIVEHPVGKLDSD